MKNLKIFALFLVLPMFFACQREEPLRADPFGNYVTVTYSLNVLGNADLSEVRFLGQDNTWKTVANPSAFWQYEMDVEKGFLAKIELLGNVAAGNGNQVTIRIKEENDHGFSNRTHTELNAGEFHSKLEFLIEGR